jgi:hypothetical protein
MTDTAEPAFDGLATHETTNGNQQSSRIGGKPRG